MERKAKRKDSESNLSRDSIVENIKALASHNARAALNTEESMLLFLQSWWSRTYNRPLKDPLLQSYTIEELLYEFFDRIERQKAEQERIESESDRIEEAKERADEDWAEKMEREELEAEMRKNAAKNTHPDPTQDPENIAWMEEQLKRGKEEFGEDFGEDIKENFEE